MMLAAYLFIGVYVCAPETKEVECPYRVMIPHAKTFPTLEECLSDKVDGDYDKAVHACVELKTK